MEYIAVIFILWLFIGGSDKKDKPKETKRETNERVERENNHDNEHEHTKEARDFRGRKRR